jgi:RNA polymerase sigma-70 factor (ECF subfamily)
MTDEIDRKTPERSVLKDEQSRLLWAAIDELDEKHRLPIILRYFHEMPTEEIAKVLEISVGTVHSRLHNARSRLNGDLQRIQQGLGGTE